VIFVCLILSICESIFLPSLPLFSGHSEHPGQLPQVERLTRESSRLSREVEKSGSRGQPCSCDSYFLDLAGFVSSRVLDWTGHALGYCAMSAQHISSSKSPYCPDSQFGETRSSAAAPYLRPKP